MIALDTNILVYAHREDSAFHDAASRTVAKLAEGRAGWGIPWPCIHEFLAIVTHPRIYDPPTTLAAAIDQVEAWIESPSLVLLGETVDHWPTLEPLLVQGKIAGPLVHDARVAAIAIAHGVRDLWTADRDFSRFSALTVKNPLVRSTGEKIPRDLTAGTT
jgi:toxin-antitoxin system PIN domain toxin